MVKLLSNLDLKIVDFTSSSSLLRYDNDNVDQNHDYVCVFDDQIKVIKDEVYLYLG